MPRKVDIPADFFLQPRSVGASKPASQDNGKTLSRQNEEEPRHREAARVGRPPTLEGPKEAVTLYLTEPTARRLEEVRYLLLTEYGVRTSKSALADFALRHSLQDLEALAAELGGEKG